MSAKRYQECPLLIRIFRMRWYLVVPWWALKTNNWSLAVGLAHCKMRYLWTWEEVEESLHKMQKDNDHDT